MPRYRHNLPQLRDEFFMTDGGIETTLIFQEGQDLPHFAAFHLLKSQEGFEVLRKYFRSYVDLAARFATGLILETATWRANPDWAAKLGYDARALATANRAAVDLVAQLRDESGYPVVVSGCIGPRGDGYVPDRAMSAREAQNYHRAQIATFAATDADLVTAITMNYVEEAVGIALAAREAEMPAVISFTVETDGRLPTGQSLEDAIRQTDFETSAYPAYYMLNCAHPAHFTDAVRDAKAWMSRIRGLRANASKMSHAELNEATELDPGDPVELGHVYASLLRGGLGQLHVFGGCCGTDLRHVEQIATACLPAFHRSV